MAKVYFVKSGEVQGEKFVTDKPLEFCFDVLGLRVWKWHSPVERNGPFILSTNEDSTSKNDRHRIDVKRKSGPYRELRIEVRDAPIEVNEMIVTFVPQIKAESLHHRLFIQLFGPLEQFLQGKRRSR